MEQLIIIAAVTLSALYLGMKFIKILKKDNAEKCACSGCNKICSEKINSIPENID